MTRARYLAMLCVALLFVSAARAGDPQINGLAPYGVQRGTEATFTINGSGLATAKEILFYTPGFTVKKLPVKLTNINNVEYGPDGRLYALGSAKATVRRKV